jgi:predicted ester cyclase
MAAKVESAVLLKNKNIARSLLAAWNRKGETHIPEGIAAPNLITRFPQPNAVTKADAVKANAAKADVVKAAALPRDAFPDQQFQEEIVLAENDLVFLAWSVTGTNTGPLYGRAPTGKQVTVYGADVLRLTDGKIVEHWNYHSKARLTALAKLGLLDKPMQTTLRDNGLLSSVSPE